MEGATSRTCCVKDSIGSRTTKAKIDFFCETKWDPIFAAVDRLPLLVIKNGLSLLAVLVAFVDSGSTICTDSI